MAKMLLASADEATIDIVSKCLRGTSHYLWTLQDRIGLDTVLREMVDPTRVLIFDDAEFGHMATVLMQSKYNQPIVRVGLLDGADFFGPAWRFALGHEYSQFIVPKPLNHDVLKDALLRAAQESFREEDMGKDRVDTFIVETGPISTLCAPAPKRRRKTRLLLANDDSGTLSMLAAVLKRTGRYIVTSSCGGGETLGLLADRKNRFDVLVSNIVNPYMRGGRLIEQSLRIQPTLSVLICSHIWDVMEEVIDLVQCGHASAVVPSTALYDLPVAIEKVIRLKSVGGGPSQESPRKHWWGYRKVGYASASAQ